MREIDRERMREYEREGVCESMRGRESEDRRVYVIY